MSDGLGLTQKGRRYHEGEIDLSTVELLFGHSDEESAYVVGDYPYGFNRRTSIRYWIESVAKKGDRFVSQTLNPKTGRWNKPKKSTYSQVGVMYLDEQGHVKWTGLSYYSSSDAIAEFCGTVGAEALNEVQKIELAKLIGVKRISKHIKWSVTSAPWVPRDQETDEQREAREAHEREQTEIKQRIARAAGVEAHRAHKALGG